MFKITLSDSQTVIQIHNFLFCRSFMGLLIESKSKSGVFKAKVILKFFPNNFEQVEKRL